MRKPTVLKREIARQICRNINNVVITIHHLPEQKALQFTVDHGPEQWHAVLFSSKVMRIGRKKMLRTIRHFLELAYRMAENQPDKETLDQIIQELTDEKNHGVVSTYTLNIFGDCRVA